MDKPEKKIIGFYGCPPRAEIERIRSEFPEHEWIDLDVGLDNPDTGKLPETYCRIIRNIVDNAIALKKGLHLIVAAIGADKCEGGRYAAFLLQEMGFNVREFQNDEILSCDSPESIKVPISTSSISLIEKIERIMKTVLEDDSENYDYIKPTCGFWGVPPDDFELLKLFPDSTHVYGWTRAVEAGRPADIDLESYVEPGVPTVFYTQNFCAKSQLAKYLAEKHGGLFIDADGKIGMGIRARIEAFLELNI